MGRAEKVLSPLRYESTPTGRAESAPLAQVLSPFFYVIEPTGRFRTRLAAFEENRRKNEMEKESAPAGRAEKLGSSLREKLFKI